MCHEFKLVYSHYSCLHSKHFSILTWIRSWFNGLAPSKSSLPTGSREKKCFFLVAPFSNLPAKSNHNPNQSPQHLCTATWSVLSGDGGVMLLCEGIRLLSRTLVEVGSSTGVERWSGWFYWLSFGKVWIVILLSDSQLLSKSTLPGFIYAGFICVWAEVALLGPGGYIWCVNGFVMLFACDMDQLPAEKISRTDHQHMLCFGCWYVVPLLYYRLASLFNPCVLCVMSGLPRCSFWPRIAHVDCPTCKTIKHSPV